MKRIPDNRDEMNQHMGSDCDNPSRNCINCDLKSPLFCFLNEEELALIQLNKIKVLFRTGETIRKQGTHMSHVISVVSGLAKVYLEGIGQRNAILSIVKPTNFIGGPGIYLDQLHHHSVTALMDTEVCFIEVSIFKQIIDKNKIFAREFMRDFSQNILSVYSRLINLTQKQMPGRMADTLIYLSEEVFQSLKFTMYLSKQDLSELSGMSKESAIKILREFQNDGIIHLSEKELDLVDINALRRISKTG